MNLLFNNKKHTRYVDVESPFAQLTEQAISFQIQEDIKIFVRQTNETNLIEELPGKEFEFDLNLSI